MTEQTEAANDTPDMTLARKLSAKTVVGGNVRKYMILDKKDAADPNDAGNTDAKAPRVTRLFQVWGHANGTRRGTGDNGPWIALLGRFEAVPIVGDDKGAIVTGPQCFLPEPANSMLASQLELTDENGRRVSDSLEFAFEIGVKPTETSIGYEYVTTPIIKPGGADPLANLRRKIPALALLSAPAPEADKVPAPEADKPPPEADKPEPPKVTGKGGKK